MAKSAMNQLGNNSQKSVTQRGAERTKERETALDRADLVGSKLGLGGSELILISHCTGILISHCTGTYEYIDVL